MSIELQIQGQGLAVELRPVEPVSTLQREVQRKLGRCLIRLQQYERLMKAFAVDFEIAGPSDELMAIRQKRGEVVSRMTLGQLVAELTGTYLQPEPPDTVEPEWNPVDSQRIWFRMQTRMALQPEDYERVVVGLKELVALRNELVHHFLERFDIWSEAGCHDADAYLDVGMAKVDGHYAELRQWAITMDQARSAMGAFMASPAYTDLLFDGIRPDGTVDWPTCGIVRCLRTAETVLAVDGWADLGQVIERMNLMHPEQALKRYGCTTWRQVLHESKQFKIRRDQGSAERPGRTEFQSLTKPLQSSDTN
ncbi:OST-HTH/LOTUS domain-containing protein [Variovorax sp. YR266]|uniref:OST-HTH/LOTUS domain-containing protein n=1 Tax=Variovorax sp. YR266 TaxID=1884386 RepID=UPI000B826490|nr:OST-HTH/LOTUS domain-containing protein [Variovorax sp. YR266]